MKYTIAEFRKNMRSILNAVDGGADVTIERYDKLYSIKPTVRGDSGLPHTMGKPASNLCPHGYSKGMCKKDVCNRKYKNDKA